jgi:hypothetical protein
MSSNNQIAVRFAEIAKILETEDDLKAFHRHLEDVLSGESFRSSHRSGQFLRHIVEQAVEGRVDSLKERVIGAELFNRSPNYDTGEDAIVRVTASDVRKRLLQHYGAYRNVSEFRINLPLGSYIPEILREPPPTLPVVEPKSEGASDTVAPPVPIREIEKVGRKSWKKASLAVLVALLLLNIALWVSFLVWLPKPLRLLRPDPLFAQLFPFPFPIRLITSDPNIAEIQGLTGQAISLSDYANYRYIPDPTKTDPRIVHLASEILRGDKAAAVDADLVARIASQLAQTSPGQLKITPARDMRLSDLLTDGNFILLGSFRSNPWSLFYNEKLDFRIVMDPNSNQEIVTNVHPHPGELNAYVPTAKGYATGQSFATVSYLENPDHRGRVLLLAGANAEGTFAAGQIVTDSSALSAALRKCGIRSVKSGPNFQMLLRLSTMAGSPGHVDVVACHLLSQ